MSDLSSGRARRPWRLALLALASASLLSACAPLVVGGVVVSTGIVVTDRRTTGIQIEDQSIDFKAASRARDVVPLGRVAVNTYNLLALVTGEVPTEADKAAVEKAVAGVENVRTVINELAVTPNASLSRRSSDTALEAKVKASFVDAADLQANAFRVVAERGIVYLLGRVTEREAERATSVARSVPGVQKVVRVLEILSEEELAALNKKSTAPQ